MRVDLLQGSEASENDAADESSTTDTTDVDEPEKTSPEAADTRKTCQQHVATTESVLGWKDFLLGRRVRYTSKISSNRAMWSSVLAVSAIVLVSLVLLVNISGYLRFKTAY